MHTRRGGRVLFLVSLFPSLAAWLAPPTPRVSLLRCRGAGASGGLPPDALVTQAVDEPTWKEERRRLLNLASDPSFPRGFAKYLRSVNMGAKGSYHAFAASGELLEDFMWSEGGASKSDEERLEMIRDLLESVGYLHDQGLPHLGLSGKTVYLRRHAGYNRVKVVGIGAGPQLIAASRPFQLAEGSWEYQPPEVLQSAVIQSNLPALLAMDAWSVGVLVAMLTANTAESPFKVKPGQDFARLPLLLLTEQTATFNKIAKVLADPGKFLRRLDRKGDGFLFRHPWLIQVISSLLVVPPNDRMSTTEAFEIVAKSMQFEATQNEPVVVTAESEVEPVSRAPEVQALQLPADTADIISAAGETPEAVLQEVIQEAAAPKADAPKPAAPKPAVNELPQFSPTVKQEQASGEPFRSLEAILNIAEGGLCQVLVEDRGQEWKDAGMRNYGEIVGFRNRADGDRWDVFMPGIGEGVDIPPGKRLRIARVLGVLMVKGGNHKLAVQLDGYKLTGRRSVRDDVRKFLDGYVALHPGAYRKRVKYMTVERL